jgi:hypothetical protein
MRSFILHEEAARDWVTSLIVAYELTDLDMGTSLNTLGRMPQLGMAWQPREPGQEDIISALIHDAHHQPDVLTHPEHAETAIEFLDDGDDWSYHFLLEVTAPPPVTLTSRPRQIQQLGDDSAFGVNAAIGILREAAQTANALLDQLNAFIAGTREP